MNAARLANSARLQRVDRILATGLEYSTMQIIQLANVCAVNSIICELRENGREIECRREGDVWYYSLAPQPSVGAGPCACPLQKGAHIGAPLQGQDLRVRPSGETEAA